MPRMVRGVTVVFAHWCPHCDPPALEASQRIGRELGVPVKFLDIDVREQEREADRIVSEHGDWTDDYLIPQIFLELTDGTVRHVFTGRPEGVPATRRALTDLLESQWYKELVDFRKE
jgi:thiol-disulfide isomerase/thioredoxin